MNGVQALAEILRERLDEGGIEGVGGVSGGHLGDDLLGKRKEVGFRFGFGREDCAVAHRSRGAGS